MSANTITQSQFNAYPAAIQESLTTQGFVVVPDPVEQPVAAVETPATAGAPNLLLQGVAAGNEPEEDPNKSDLFANIYVVHGGKRYRLTYTAMDSDFVQYTDKEKTKRNGIRDAIVDAVKQVGLDKANEVLKFEVELTQTGHTQQLNLLAGA